MESPHSVLEEGLRTKSLEITTAIFRVGPFFHLENLSLLP